MIHISIGNGTTPESSVPMAIIAKVIEVSKTKLLQEKPACHGTLKNNPKLMLTGNQISRVTFAETQMEAVKYGAMLRYQMILRMTQSPKITEVYRPRPRVEEHVRDGMPSGPKSIAEPQVVNTTKQLMALSPRTTVGIQMVTGKFGATQTILVRDMKNAIQCNLVKELKNATKNQSFKMM